MRDGFEIALVGIALSSALAGALVHGLCRDVAAWLGRRRRDRLGNRRPVIRRA